ncbi:MAG: clostripain-related cysteine peptidase, partial [Bacteroidales bacterium]
VSIETGYPDRTVLLYIIGDNSLSKYANRNIDSIMSGMSRVNTTMQMLIYEDTNASDPCLWKIEKDAAGKVIKTAVRAYKEQDSANPVVMQMIISDVFTSFPAKEKGLFLWSHGSGWLPSPNFRTEAPRQRSIGPDKTTYLEIWDIRDVLSKTNIHFDFVIFDACLMATVEVAYELKDVTDYLIASPTEVMGIGFPYQTIIPVLGRTELDLPGLCDAYMYYYNGNSPGRDGTISLIQTDKLDELAKTYGSILKTSSMDLLSNYSIQEMGRRIPFSSTDYRNIFYDMGDVVNHLSTDFAPQFRQNMEGLVVHKGHTTRFDTFEIYRYSGLTVFVPELNDNELYNKAYEKLQWYAATR